MTFAVIDDSHLLECGIESKEYEQKETINPIFITIGPSIEEDYDWREVNLMQNVYAKSVLIFLILKVRLNGKKRKSIFECAN